MEINSKNINLDKSKKMKLIKNKFFLKTFSIKSQKSKFYYSLALVAIFVSVIAGNISFDRSSLSSNVIIENQNTKAEELDNLISVQLASSLAKTVDIPIETNIENLKVSTEIKSELSKYETNVISKPQILTPAISNRIITRYTVNAGDTLDSIASTYRINKETIKWANNLISDNLSVGKELIILPVNGILYTVKAGDTYDSIAEKYRVDKQNIVSYNDLELSGMTVGSQIILPDAVLPATERPGYVAPRLYFSYATGGGSADVTFLYVNTSPTSAGNKHAWGNCTWYVWERRNQLGGAWILPSAPLGNAAQWAYSLGNAGYRVDRRPSFGAIMQNGGEINGYGHVAFVESIEPNGDVIITEMNFYNGRWYNIVSKRRVLAAAANNNYNYIHEKVR